MRGIPDSKRQRDLIDVCFGVMANRHPHRSREELIRNLFCNVSQSVDRLPVTYGLGTIATSTEYYGFEKDAILSGASHLRVLGLPTDFMPHELFEDHVCRQMGGMGFSVPIAAELTFLFWCNPHAPWCEP